MCVNCIIQHNVWQFLIPDVQIDNRIKTLITLKLDENDQYII